MKDYRQAIISYIRQNAKPGDKFGHQPRLYQLALQVGAGSAFDDDVVFAAAWMHDLGVFIGHRPEELPALASWDMIAYALKTVPGLLEKFGFPVEKIPLVMEVIRTHQPACTPVSLEATILRDADILEQLGAVGILRTVCKVGRDTRFKVFRDALKVLQRNADELPGKLRLENARRLAEPRIKVLRDFIAAAENEANGGEL